MKLAIEGMHCQSCVRRVRQAIEKVEGAEVRQVEVGSADVAVEPSHQAAVLESIRKAGYEPRESA